MTLAAAGNGRATVDFEDPVIEVFEFLHSVYGRRLPRITFIISRKRIADARGKVKIRAEFHKRARPTVALVRELLALAEKPGHEIFFRVAPMDTDGLSTTKDNALPVNVIWTEVDSHGLTGEELAFLNSVNATIVESGGIADDGGAKTHVYVPLSATHQPGEIEHGSLLLRERMRGDRFDVTTMLRLPGSWHRKDPDNPVRVSVRRYSTAARVKLPDVVSTLGTGADSARVRSRVSGASIEPVEPPRNDLAYGRGRKVRRDVDGQILDAECRGEAIDRSDRLWGLYCELAKVGVLDPGHILWAAQGSEYLAERVSGKDVARFLRSDAYTRAKAEWESRRKPEPPQPAVSAVPAVSSKDTRDGEAEAAFWAARPVLTHIRDFAHSRLVSSWATFGITVARVMNQIPTEVLLPPLVGGRTGLNFYVGIVDSSGVGKGASEGAAEECFETADVFSVNIGSGEGIAHAYMSRRKATLEEVEEGVVGKGETVMEMHTHSVLFTAPEIDTLTAIKGRSSSTLSAELRKAWSGERLGFMYVTEAKRLTIEKHTYRMTLVCGVQPTRAESLLDESGGGLPQRFLWMPASDPGIPELDNLRDVEPMPLKLPDFFHEVSTPTGMVTMDVCESARREIRSHQHAKIKRAITPDPLDSHRNLVRLKVAAALAFMDGRKAVSEEDWALANVVMGVSDRTRNFIRTEITRARSDISRERGRDDAVREVAKREHVESETAGRVWRRLEEVLRAAEKPMTMSDLEKKVTMRDRAEVADVVAEMTEKGLVRETGTNRKGNAMYERAG